MAHRGGLAARDHQGVNGIQLREAPDRGHLGARFAQGSQMLSGVPLQGQDTDVRAHSAGGTKPRL
ncbi:hypothetical protein MTY66_35100 [Mycolicibacterium sp. TY66]|nr:hypothetical protein MTY66_35100 [Mycolicibacterium sp. TY66]BCJ80466.1 hypothetical protein MTY81_18390 [Mycolicibacterium sp. TY81]GCA99827.1 hypothetical protein NCCNTM_34620 [Mycolicibacterium sp. NCC-Tsukiji]